MLVDRGDAAELARYTTSDDSQVTHLVRVEASDVAKIG